MKLFLMIALMVLVSCAPFGKTEYTVWKFLPQESLFFPKGAFSLESRADSFENESFSRTLRNMKEPILFKDPSTIETYRFTWLRSFQNPITIRMEFDHGNVVLVKKETNDPKLGDTLKFVINKKNKLSFSDWKTFDDEQQKNPFWKLLPVYDEGVTRDGEVWILESKKPTGYHVMKRFSPNEGNVFRNYCEELLRLSGIKTAMKEIY